MDDLILNLGESKLYYQESFIGSYIIPLVRLVEKGFYTINGNIHSLVSYKLNFNGDIKDVDSQLFGFSYYLTIDEPTEIFLKFEEEIAVNSFNVSVIRTG